MKIDKLNIDGKKDTIEVLDKIFLARINRITTLEKSKKSITENTKHVAKTPAKTPVKPTAKPTDIQSKQKEEKK